MTTAKDTWESLKLPLDECGCNNCANLTIEHYRPECEWMYHVLTKEKCYQDEDMKTPSKWIWNRKV